MLIQQLKENPESVSFSSVIEYIDAHYDFVPTSFRNGEFTNEEGQNNGSCKIFYFAKLHQLSQQETLHLFGDYYRKDVLENPEGTDHMNIRNFMNFGWDGIFFEKDALIKK